MIAKPDPTSCLTSGLIDRRKTRRVHAPEAYQDSRGRMLQEGDRVLVLGFACASLPRHVVGKLLRVTGYGLSTVQCVRLKTGVAYRITPEIACRCLLVWTGPVK
jgi:hypothetical protein